MPFNSEGAGRSKTLACFPTARGTVAPTRCLEEFFSGPTCGFFQDGSWWGVQGLLCERISGAGGLRGRGFLTTPKNRQKTQNRTAAVGLPGPCRGGLVGASQVPSGPCRGLSEILHKTFEGLSRHLAPFFRASEQGFPQHSTAPEDCWASARPLKASQNLQRTNEKVLLLLLLTKMDLTEFRSYTLKGVGLGGLAALDGVRRVIMLHGLLHSGHGGTSHAAMHLKDH